MSKKKIAAVIILLLVAICSNLLILKFVRITSVEDKDISVCIEMSASDSDYIQLFYSEEILFEEKKSSTYYYETGDVAEIRFSVERNNPFLRVDLGNKPMKINIDNCYFYLCGVEYQVNIKDVFGEKHNLNEINNIVDNSQGISFETTGQDPFFIVMYDETAVVENAIGDIEKKSLMVNILFCIVIDVIILICISKLRSFVELPLEVIREKKLIWNLSKNDFKTKYAGSYLGIIWAFVQPIITVLVYWFVFEVGLKSGRVSEYPFILFLMSGLVPWFFFSDSLNGGTSSLIEYNYLVKKVVFNISVLPIVKIVSALFVHIFFVVVVGIICVSYGYSIDIYWLQIPYYILCTIASVLGLVYLTCSIVCFFRDLTQIISIVLQVGMWVTPIMWQVSILSPTLQTVFKINPMYYVVEGYRDCFLGKNWFWEDMTWTIYFWIVTIIGLGIGISTFKKLRVHFADVL